MLPSSSDQAKVGKGSPAGPAPSVVAGWLRVLIGPASVAELRAVDVATGTGGWTATVTGFYDSDHLDAMAEKALEITAKAEGVYFTLNPLQPELLARLSNKAKEIKKKDISAGDKNVLRRRWLLVDADPKRIKGISSTDAEKALAWDTVQAVRDYLGAAGWPAPILADSGNGFHLLYRIDLPADDSGLVRRVLHALAKRFDTDRVTIDTAVSNPGRICKLYGTLARKGESVADRPHRRAMILEIPGCDDVRRPDTAAVEVVPAELLETVAAELPVPEPAACSTSTASGTGAPRLRVADWLTDRGVGFKMDTMSDGRDRYRLDHCPFDPSHVGKDVAVFQNRDGKLGFKCLHNSCSGRGWQQAKEQIGRPTARHFDLPPAPGPAEKLVWGGEGGAEPADGRGDAWEGAEPEVRRQEPAKPLFTFISSAEFASRAYPRTWLIDHVLVEGQPAVIGGGFKTLKTTLTVEAALSIGAASPFLGQFRVPRRRRVVVLSGESGEPTLQETALRISLAKGIELPSVDVFWGFKLPQLANATHVRELRTALEDCGAEVVLLDPLYLSLLAGVGGELSAANFYQIGPLLMDIGQTCLEVNCTPALVHHFKTTRANPYDEPQLEDLAFSGIKEYARQWLLLGRREKYVPRSGEHKLWLSIGGSAGHSALWAVDVNEGMVKDDFTGRTWDVKVRPAGDARHDEALKKDDEKTQRQEQKERDDEAKLLGTLDKLDPDREGYGIERLSRAAGLTRRAADGAVARLAADGVLIEVTVKVPGGKGAAFTAKGVCRPGVNQEDDLLSASSVHAGER
jgi:hypothetical protein